MNVVILRKAAKTLMGGIVTELKVLDKLYFFQCKQGVGYIFSLSKYPNLKEVADKTFAAEGEVWGCAYQGYSYLKIIWLYPEVIDALKTSAVNSLKAYRKISKAEYRKAALHNAYEVLSVCDRPFIEKHPEPLELLKGWVQKNEED